jgi:hypothetical protein
VNPSKRMTQEELKDHPFITGEEAEFSEEDSKEEDTLNIISQSVLISVEQENVKLRNQEFSKSQLFEIKIQKI